MLTQCVIKMTKKEDLVDLLYRFLWDTLLSYFKNELSDFDFGMQ